MKRSDICVIAIAECFRGDSDILCNPIGISPIIGGRLAKATFAQDVVMTDAVSVLATNPLPIGDPDALRIVESYVPYRTIFDMVWSGRRHVMMGATQIDQFGNQNIAAIGGFEKPKAQLLGLRGAPGNLINHRTSYWVPNHSKRTIRKLGKEYKIKGNLNGDDMYFYNSDPIKNKDEIFSLTERLKV